MVSTQYSEATPNNSSELPLLLGWIISALEPAE
jgi:hypothetical protein